MYDFSFVKLKIFFLPLNFGIHKKYSNFSFAAVKICVTKNCSYENFSNIQMQLKFFQMQLNLVKVNLVKIIRRLKRKNVFNSFSKICARFLIVNFFCAFSIFSYSFFWKIFNIICWLFLNFVVDHQTWHRSL